MHARYFIEHFITHPRFPLLTTISKNAEGNDCLVTNEGTRPISIQDLSESLDPTYIFFNSGRWIEELPQIRSIFPKATFLYRTGGNEILKAPLNHEQILNHALRQSYWTRNINSTIDLMITNSAYTERRLRDVGLTCPFKRYVGGVNTTALKTSKMPTKGSVTIFCAARFVPYKNHCLLLTVIRQLVSRGYKLQLRLAGDGPLLSQAQEQVMRENLTPIVKFLGVLDNEEVCQEIAHANIYMQFSNDQMTEVPGGSYIHAEGMGRSILEALTAGTFVVAGRCGALEEIVKEDNGLLLDLNHLDQIFDQIERVIKHPPVRRPFSEWYSWTNLFKQYEKLLEELDENIARDRKM